VFGGLAALVAGFFRLGRAYPSTPLRTCRAPMRLIAELSWAKVSLVAASWLIVWMLILTIPSLIWTHEMRGNPRVAAVGFGLTRRGVVLLLVPPLMLLVIKCGIGFTAPN
jgi:hypothetical protein